MNDELLKNKKRWLYRYKKNRTKVLYLQDKLHALESRMISVRSPNYSGLPKSSNPITIIDLLSDKQSLEERIKRFELRGLEIKHEILEAIDNLDNCIHAELLEYWFIDCLSPGDICEMMGYSERYIFMLYSKALKEITIPDAQIDAL